MHHQHEDIGTYLERLLHEGQIKLEITGGTRTWRLRPSPRHQKMIDRIRATIAPVYLVGAQQRQTETGGHTVAPRCCAHTHCLCYHLSDVMLKFPDGSLKRPDIAIFCVEPPDIDEAWEQVPEAVIEIVSLDYEAKDLSINPPWYLAQGVKDVLVVDPRARRVTHFSHGQASAEHALPRTFMLHCGCQVTIA